jgi:3-dehydroquinate dehydratase/shikimate dehydrogenase
MARADGADVVKLAWSARSVRDNLEAFDMLAERGRPMIALCMGPFGLMSRVLAPKFGALLTFAAVAPGGESAPGQPTIDDLRRRFRFDAIGPATRVYGVVGWPVDHSRSPDVHNAGFEAVGHDGVHLPLPVPPEYEHFKATVGSLVDHPRLDFAGASVTVPHKTHLLRFVRERDGTVDSLTDLVGAANTLVVRSDGSLAATNTDAGAALEALCAGMEIDEGGLAGRRVAVLGAGGVARAVTAGLARRGAAVSLFARDRDRAAALAGELHGRPATSGAAAEVVAPDPATLATDRYDVIVNGTPVGMAGGPAPDDSPLALLAGGDVTLDESTTVFDTVYTPERTPLIADAEARGARVVTGAEMFIRQAMRQFELWTGKPAPRAVFEHVLTARIG